MTDDKISGFVTICHGSVEYYSQSSGMGTKKQSYKHLQAQPRGAVYDIFKQQLLIWASLKENIMTNIFPIFSYSEVILPNG